MLSSGHNGELMLADGTPVGKVVDWHFESEHNIEHTRAKFRELFERPVINVQGTLTSEGIGILMGQLEADTTREIACCISKRRFWELLYLAQGKRYPSSKKRKSKARMSKKWRDRA